MENVNLIYFLKLVSYCSSLSCFVAVVIATSSLDSYIRIWDLQSGEKTKTIESGPVDVWSLTFTPDAKHIVSGSHSGKINWFTVETGKLEQSFDTRGKFTLSIACVMLL